MAVALVGEIAPRRKQRGAGRHHQTIVANLMQQRECLVAAGRFTADRDARRAVDVEQDRVYLLHVLLWLGVGVFRR